MHRPRVVARVLSQMAPLNFGVDVDIEATSADGAAAAIARSPPTAGAVSWDLRETAVVAA